MQETDFGIVGERKYRGEINLSVYRLLVYAAIFSRNFCVRLVSSSVSLPNQPFINVGQLFALILFFLSDLSSLQTSFYFVARNWIKLFFVLYNEFVKIKCNAKIFKRNVKTKIYDIQNLIFFSVLTYFNIALNTFSLHLNLSITK